MRAKKQQGHGELTELATRQHGVVATWQLRALGYRENLIYVEVGRERLRRIHRGVYAVGHEALDWNGRCMAAVLACVPSVASHWSAAYLHGLLSSSPTTPHVTAPTKRRQRPRFVVHFSRLDHQDVTEIEGIPVTSVERTVLDLTAAAPKLTAGILERLDKPPHAFDLRRFGSLLARSVGHPGYTPLKSELALYREDFDPAFTRSKLEKRFRRLLRASDLLMPQANVYVGEYELDCWWEPERFAVELDTFGTHGSRRSFESDRRRQRELALRGIAVERVTDTQLRDEPEEVLAAVRARLAERAPTPGRTR
jgi:very-short-patch-repair endonuclease